MTSFERMTCSVDCNVCNMYYILSNAYQQNIFIALPQQYCRAVTVPHNATLQSVAHLAWKQGACHRRAAFDITFQHKTTVCLKTGNQPMKFAMLPKYYIYRQNYANIQYIGNIYS